MTRSGPVTDLELVVTLDGVELSTGWTGGLQVVDPLSVTWGRDAILEDPTPSTGRLTLFDPSRTWATAADRRGLPVTIGYRGTSPDGSALSALFFRGRIGGDPKVALRTVVTPVEHGSRRVTGALVELRLQSVLVDLANVVPRESWPVEDMGVRVDRVIAAAQLHGVLTGGGSVRDYWRPPNVAAVARKDQVSLLEHLSALFRSAGSDSYTYDPHGDRMLPVSDRTTNTTWATLARITWDQTPDRPRNNTGAFVSARSIDYLDPFSQDAAGVYLDARALEYDPADGLAMPQRITRVAVSHPDSADGYNTRTAELPVTGPDGLSLDARAAGVRTAQIDSRIVTASWVDLALSDTERMVRHEGSRWLLADPLRFSSRRAGGFETVDAVQLLLAGYERNDVVFLQASHLPQLGVRPVFAVLGGTIAYRRGGWEVEAQVAPMATTAPQHSITWEEIDDGTAPFQLQWHDGPHSRGFHSSLTFEDLRYVGNGLNVAATPASTDWDEQQ